MEQAIQGVEAVLGHVSVSTLITMMILSVGLTWAFITKIWPTLKQIAAAILARRDERNKQKHELKALNDWKKGADVVLTELQKGNENISKTLKSIEKGQDLLMDAQKATFDVLTKMLSCMTSEKDPDECVQEAMGTISQFLIHEHGRVQ